MDRLKTDIFKWSVVILTLLFLPYGSAFLVVVFSFLFLRKKIYNIDLLILYFLAFFITKVGGGGGVSSIQNIRYLLIVVSFFNTVGQQGFSYKPLLKNISFLFIFILLHSLLFSYNPMHSLFEFMIFGVLILFTFKNSYFQNIEHRTRLINTIEAMYIAFIILSAISMLSPSISYMRNGVGFQGVSNQPNALGIVLAPYAGFIFIRLFKSFSIKDLFLFIVSFVFIYLSQSRTSLLSVFLGLITIMIVSKELRALISKKVFALIIIGGVFLIFNFQSFNSFVYGFLSKSKDQTIGESVIASRGRLFDIQSININNHLFEGVGFKMPSSLKIEGNVFSMGKLYEKGNMIMASIEELGVMGLIIIIITLISLMKIKRNKASSLLILPFIAIFTTMGEATLFSIGGAGVLVWVFVFISFHNGILGNKIK